MDKYGLEALIFPFILEINAIILYNTAEYLNKRIQYVNDILFVERFGVYEGLKEGTLTAALGFLGGYAYAKLADLPELTVAKYWAIKGFATTFFQKFFCSFTDKPTTQSLIHRVTFVTSNVLFISFMRYQNLMGDFMMNLIIAGTAMSLLVQD